MAACTPRPATIRQVVLVGSALIGVNGLPGAKLTRITNQAVPTLLMSTPMMLILLHIRSAMRKRLVTGVALCHSDRVSGWHQLNGVMLSGKLQSWLCWCLC